MKYDGNIDIRNSCNAQSLQTPQGGTDKQFELLKKSYDSNRILQDKLNTLEKLFSHKIVRSACWIYKATGIVRWLVLLPELLFYLFYFSGRILKSILRSPHRIKRIMLKAHQWLKILTNPRQLRMELKHPGITRPVGIDDVLCLTTKLRSLSVACIAPPDERLHINIVVPTLDPDLTFGGYISLFQLVRHLLDRGFPVRFLVGEDPKLTYRKVIKDFSGKPKLQEMFRRCEFLNLERFFDNPIFVHGGDRFIAYSGWMGLLANQLASRTPFKRFVYFIQEYEPIFHHNDSYRAILESTYRLPHVPIFNTQLLCDYFRQEKLGIFDPAFSGSRDDEALTFEHAIANLDQPGANKLESRTVRKLLFYARPEAHAGRNLFALGVMGLRNAVERGYFEGPWEFWGIGSLVEECTLKLTDDAKLKIIPRVPLEQYEAFLRRFDVGMSLMMAPHPSILPFEMLSAGMVVVTNKYKYRDAEYFEGISRNIIPCQMSVDGIAGSLREAASKSMDTDARMRDAGVKWNRNWDDAFSGEFMDQLIAKLAVR